MKAQKNQIAVGVLFLFFYAAVRSTGQPSATNAAAGTNAIQADMEAAIHQVEKIVNQPVTAYRRVPGMNVGKFEGGWFHPGATKPNFNTVDVRTTRETAVYDKYEYSTSDLNPGIVWLSKQLEFNSMTKYFYTNRNVPKKRLTEAEMVEINRLYKVIGHGEQELAKLRNHHPAADESGTASAPEDANSNDPASTSAKKPRLLNPYVGGGAILLLAALLLLINFIRKK